MGEIQVDSGLIFSKKKFNKMSKNAPYKLKLTRKENKIR